MIKVVRCVCGHWQATEAIKKAECVICGGWIRFFKRGKKLCQLYYAKDGIEAKKMVSCLNKLTIKGKEKKGGIENGVSKGQDRETL